MDWILLSLLPAVENRGAILLALSSGVNPLTALVLSSILSFFGGLALYLVLERIEPLLRSSPVRFLYDRYVDGVRRKGAKYIRKYGKYALLIFVAVPFPGSGAYTGAVLAYLFNISHRETALGLFLGSFLAGVVVLIASASLMALIL